MLRSNKGSILVTTLIIFSIICTVCMGCIALIYSNNNYFNLEYKYMEMKEMALSGLEITKSNILQEVKHAIENCNNEKEFTEYFLGNTSSILGDTYNAGLENVFVSIDSRPIQDMDGSISFKITSNCRSESYNKKISANIKIKNPWTKYGEDKSNDLLEEKIDVSAEENNDDDNEENIDTSESDKQNFNENNLVVIYNYKEI